MKYLLIAALFLFSCTHKEEKKPLPKFKITVYPGSVVTKDSIIHSGGVLYIKSNVIIEYAGQYISWEPFNRSGQTFFEGEIKK